VAGSGWFVRGWGGGWLHTCKCDYNDESNAMNEINQHVNIHKSSCSLYKGQSDAKNSSRLNCQRQAEKAASCKIKHRRSTLIILLLFLLLPY